jgi:ATP-dependent Zn protease
MGQVTEVLINWFPMLLLIAVWLYFLRKMRSGGYGKYQEQHLEAMNRQIKLLERIADAVEKRNT